MKDKEQSEIAKALIRVFESPNVSDSNWEQANIVDVLDDLAKALWYIAKQKGNPDK